MRPEEKIEKEFVKRARKLGVLCLKLTLEGQKGFPDQMVLIPKGRVLFFEFKRPNGGTTSHHQENFMFKLNELGFTSAIVNSWETPLMLVKLCLEDKDDE